MAKVQDRAMEAMLKTPFEEKTVAEIQHEMKRQQRYGLQVYVSQWGDTLSQVAQAAHKDVLQLIEENDLAYDDRLNTGTVLKNLWPVASAIDENPREAEKTSTPETCPADKPASAPPVRLLDQGVQAKQAVPGGSEFDDQDDRCLAANKAQESEEVMTDKSFLDLVNRERSHFGLVNLKKLDRDHSFLIRAFSDQSLIYSYQAGDGSLVTELALRLNQLDKPLKEEEVYQLFFRQPLFYQQIHQGLYRYHAFEVIYDEVNMTSQVFYAMLTASKTD